MDDVLITLDVDWASDEIISEVAYILTDAKVKATWFVTHDSPATRTLMKQKNLFEVGIHPNFGDGSTHGKNPPEVMNCLKRIAPKAKSVRTHTLIQSSHLLIMMRDDFDMLYDVSLFLPGSTNLNPHIFPTLKGNSLIRFPYFWEDDMEMMEPKPNFSLTSEAFSNPGLKIFAFHPMHIALNSNKLGIYSSFRSKFDVKSCSLEDACKHANKGEGAGTFFRTLVEYIRESDFHPSLTISELAEKWKVT